MLSNFQKDSYGNWILPDLNLPDDASHEDKLLKREEQMAELINELDKAVSVGNNLAKAAGHLGWTSAENIDNIRLGEAATKAWAELGYDSHHYP